MSIGTLVYLGSMAAMFVAQRLLDGFDAVQSIVTVGALLGLTAAAGLRARRLRASKDAGIKLGNRLGLMFLLVGVASLVVYTATTEGVVRGLTMGDDAEERWLGVWRSLWPIVWLLGTIPLMVVDYAIESSPITMPVRRVREMAGHGVVAALGIALIFPVNYVGSKLNERWDLAYFKTPTPGTATLAIAQSLEARVDIRIFMPPSSEVALELRSYFAGLEGENLTVEIIDQAAEPTLAQKLAVRQNGVVTFTQGEIDLSPPEVPETKADGKDGAKEDEEDDKPRPVTRRVRVATEFDKAKRTLKKIDGEVQKVLLELGHGERIAYVTTGHGELTYQGGRLPPLLQMKTFRDRLKQLGFRIKPLGLKEGLAEKVPDDADVVMVLGPHVPFQPGEGEALQRYVQGGGSVLVAMEPVVIREGQQGYGKDPLEELIESLGVSLGSGVLAQERNLVPLQGLPLQFSIATNSFTSHASSRTLAEESARVALATPGAGYLEEVENPAGTVTFTSRSLAIAWADLNANGKFDGEDGETKEARNLSAAITGGEEGAKWRAIVTSDGNLFSDRLYPNRGNQLFAEDAINWLIGAEALSGSTENEEDVKIEHTKEGQTMWFYVTVLGVPFGILLLGAARVRMRRLGAIRRARQKGSQA